MSRSPELKRRLCELCGRPLPLAGEGDAVILASFFPEQPLNCYVHLQEGPSALPCASCKHINRLGLPQAVVEVGRQGLLFMPDGFSEGSRTERRAIDAFRSNFKIDPVIVRDRRSFRRAFIKMFVLKQTNLLNSFMSAESNGAWVTEHEKALDDSFFAACWLGAHGAIEGVARPVEQGQQTDVIRHETLTEGDRHVTKQNEVVELMAQQTALVLATLLQLWAIRTMEGRSFGKFLAQAPTIVPKIILVGEIPKHLAAMIGEFVGNFELGKPSATAARYVFEALPALLFAAHDLANPRQKEWTLILSRYEFERRLDGVDEAMLLDPELVRKTIDREEFFRAMRGFAASSGALTHESLPQFNRLLETVDRIYPDEVEQIFQPEIIVDPNLSEAEATKQSIAMLRERLPEFGQDTSREKSAGDPVESALGANNAADLIITSILRGLQRHRAQILEPVMRAIWNEDSQALRPSRRIVFARRAIEYLNLAKRYGFARTIALEAEAALPEANELTKFERSTFLNEVGNCLRYAGMFPAALERYERSEALLEGGAGRNRRVITRNRAIVLRSLQRYAEAREVFAKLGAETFGLEKLQNVTSEGICLSEMGEYEKALAILDAQAEISRTLPLAAPGVKDYLLFRAQLLRRAGRNKEANEISEPLQRAPGGADDVVQRFEAARLKLAEARQLPAGAERTARHEEAVDLLREAVDQADELQGVPDARLALAESLNIALNELGRQDEAEEAVRDALAKVNPETAPRIWVLHLYAMRHALRRKDSAAVSRDMLHALISLGQAIERISATSDVIALMAPYSKLIRELVDLSVRVAVMTGPAGQELARVAADTLAAPMLSARVRGGIGLPSAIRDTDAELARLRQFERETPATYAQAVQLRSEIGILITRADKDGALRSELRLLATPPEEIDATMRRLDFHLRNLLPNATSLALERVRGWRELADDLRNAFPAMAGQSPLIVVPGPLASSPFSIVFGSERPLSFAPSIGLLLALRERRRGLPDGLSWRPRSIFDFAVWRVGDKPALAASLEQAVSEGAEAAGKRGYLHEAKIGAKADEAALLAGLSWADVTRIACHGRILPNAEAVDLLVAADGFLPPVAVAALEDEKGEAHVLGWQKLAELKDASSVAFSSACDSGAAILHAGGERLGLERPLLAAGANVFVAPQWPVPAVAIQRFMSIVLTGYMSEPTRSLARTLFEARAETAAAGLSPLAVEAVAVFGDGL